jgi:hypothetical protein
VQRAPGIPRALAWVCLCAVNIAVFAALFLALELALHAIWPRQNPWLAPPFEKSAVRIAHPVYGHMLAPNHVGEEDWGSKVDVVTNSLGFRDASPRNVALQSDRKRVLFLGDSFTEGLGTPYDQTFVGRFAAAFPDIDVLNAAVSSYAPSIYYAKTKYLIEMGLQIDEIIVYIDISDIQDEAIFYRFDAADHVREGYFDPACSSPELLFWSTPWWARWSYILEFFYTRSLLRGMTRAAPASADPLLTGAGAAYGRDRARASWTYDPSAACYGSLGIEGGIAKAIAQMDRLYALAAQHEIPLSLGVYAWPQQLLYDGEDSRQVRIWRDWCEQKCRHFFNHFPALFEYKRSHQGFLRDLFIWGDVHYNAFGNALIARDLIAQYRESP